MLVTRWKPGATCGATSDREEGGRRSAARFYTRIYSEYPTLAIHFVHYSSSADDPEDTNDDCAIGDTTQFHTYAVEWTPQSLTFLYGQTCLVDHWSAASPLVDPAPFNEPFYICLTQALGIGTNQFVAGTTPLPTTSVDWVRVWGVPASAG